MCVRQTSRHSTMATTGGEYQEMSGCWISVQGGTRLFYRDWGTGRPVVFQAGWALPSEMWNYQITPLSESGMRCIAYDRRGHGRSDDAGTGFDYDTLADDLAAVLDTLDLQRAMLVSHSMAAGEVIRYVTRHGTGRISRIVLVAPAGVPYPVKTSDNPTGFDASIFEGFRKSFLLKDYPKWMADNERPFVVEGTSNAMVGWIKHLMLQTSMKALVEFNRSGTSTDFRKELPNITVPTLVIQGDKDVSAPIERTGIPTARMIPGAKLTIYHGAPHGLFVTHMDRLNRDLIDFAAADGREPIEQGAGSSEVSVAQSIG
jgi:non-heme chloroperoxidase